MNLARHISVLWRFRRVMLLGALFGLALAFLAAYHVPSLERRGAEQWTADSDVFVTQSGFPWGRVTLAQSGDPLDGTGTETDSESDEGATPFADPGRFSELAFLYSNLVLSDVVRNTIPGRPAPGMIRAEVLDATGGGHSFLPIVKIITLGGTAESAVALNQATVDGLKSYLEKQQRESGTPTNQRVQISVINAPKDAVLVSGPSYSPSVFAFFLCIIAAVALAHILENLRSGTRKRPVSPLYAADDDGSPVNGVDDGRSWSDDGAAVYVPPDLQRDLR
jgi:hypothetical protein